ncbi:lipocalin-like domain-containing protein [Sedimentitalea nanhaiensis]|uniref:Predicted secreted hydrolase n=1 Tax=Sedimentitalea nanhaiensis TaxID=999627 RepID=A0A1I7DNE4_9RHOB|nr:lipocalin-like domain-containing protein [Sedimentitalea nanhaiensis]SFU13192.1 Predicted secreted hydrolase [Sedimentitalea nanhaiensis]
MLFLFGSAAQAQGFADLGSTAQGFAVPDRNTVLSFPRDHGAHPRFRIEWWYLTATLTGSDGQPYGVQWTLFRSALRPQDGTGWQTPQLWMGHAAVTSATEHHIAERMARGGIGQAGVIAAPFTAWIDDWAMIGDIGTGMDSLSLTARGTEFRYDLKLHADTPLVLQGERGYSVKSADGQASHYYSQPAFDVTGTLYLPDRDVQVTGQGWLDREWSSQPLSANQSGWDWFSLSFDSGARMMGFRLRDSGAGYTSATWIAPDGTTQSLPDGALQLTPLTSQKVQGRTIPTRWRVALPARQLDIVVDALNAQSWMETSFPYWEGPVSISGSHTGRGYLEMTGYD